jgi:hypothetical protein
MLFLVAERLGLPTVNDQLNLAFPHLRWLNVPGQIVIAFVAELS